MAANPSEFIANLFNVKSIAEIIKESPAKVIFNKNDIVIYTADKATRSNAFDNFRKAADKIKSNSKSKVVILLLGNRALKIRAVSPLKVPISKIFFGGLSIFEMAEKRTKCSLHIPFFSEYI